jgi:hypothetical protein
MISRGGYTEERRKRTVHGCSKDVGNDQAKKLGDGCILGLKSVDCGEYLPTIISAENR